MARSWIWALALAFLAGCAARPISPPPPDVSVFEKEEYTIGAGDILLLSLIHI